MGRKNGNARERDTYMGEQVDFRPVDWSGQPVPDPLPFEWVPGVGWVRIDQDSF